MLNPVFHSDTSFLDQRANGSLGYRTGGRALEGGVRIHPLEEKQPLFRIETESGASIVMSPETVFALRKTPDGLLVRYLPIDEAFAATPPRVDWRAPVDDTKEDIRRYAIVGMIVANGLHSTERNRPTNLTIPAGATADGLIHYLNAIADHENHGGFGQTRRPSIRQVFVNCDAHVFFKAKSLTHMAARLIEPKTQDLLFDPSDLDRLDLWNFAHGLLTAARYDGHESVILHRSIATLRSIATALVTRLGVSCRIIEGNMEQEITARRAGAHSLIFDKAALATAAKLGLYNLESVESIAPPALYRAEKIVKLEPIASRSPAVIVAGKRSDFPYPLTANTFVFESEFEVNGALTDLAAHPTMLTEPSDPTALLAAAPAHFARGIRVND